jgi:hypothetical protein
MIHFPHNPFKRPATSAANPLAPVRQTLSNDVLWNRPLFKAPALRIPRLQLELPFMAARLTRPAS